MRETERVDCRETREQCRERILVELNVQQETGA